MLMSYIKMAFRTIRKKFSSTLIQAFGLGIGLAMFILAQVIVEYEQNYDTFFKKADRIYSMYINIQPDAGIGVKSAPTTFTALQPMLRDNIPEIEKSARLLRFSMPVRVDDKLFNQDMQFADADFLDIFDFNFIRGDAATALSDPNSVVLSESVAQKYFGEDNPLGKIVLVKNKLALRVTGIIEDLPRNSHFMTSITSDNKFGMLSTVEALTEVDDFDPLGHWDGVSGRFLTYVLLPEGSTPDLFEAQLQSIYDTHVSGMAQELASGFGLRPLANVNLFLWETSGIPAMVGLRLLGFLLLLIAALNYASLASAIGLGRRHEVGIRKTLGATPGQIFLQFLIETLATTLIALMVGLMIVELVQSPMTNMFGRDFHLDFFSNPFALLGLLGLVVITGLAAGGYPAYLISRTVPGPTVQKNFGGQGKLTKTRSVMLIVQFAVSILMIIGVLVTYGQNKKMQTGAFTDIKDYVVNVYGISEDEVSDKYLLLERGW